MPKEKCYLLAEIAWEYNDEYNYRSEGEATNPQAVYTSKEEADAEAVHLNCIAIRGVDISSYGGDGLHSAINFKRNSVEEFLKWAKETLGVEWTDDGGECDVPPSLKTPLCKELLDRLKLEFWTVIEVEKR